jgi:hypothetical protein
MHALKQVEIQSNFKTDAFYNHYIKGLTIMIQYRRITNAFGME